MENNFVFKNRSISKVVSFVVVLISVITFMGNTFSAKHQNKCNNEGNLSPDTLMTWLVGTWKGEGYSYSNSIADELEWHWSLDKHFLSMHIISTQGDSFKAEGYLHYIPKENSFSFYEFSNQSGVRNFKGEIKNDELILDEMPPDKNMVLKFKFRNKNEFLLEEYSYTRDDIAIHVSERFKRKQ